MTDPLDKATSQAPAVLGEGCLSRYDPDELDAEDGTDFPGGGRTLGAVAARAFCAIALRLVAGA